MRIIRAFFGVLMVLGGVFLEWVAGLWVYMDRFHIQMGMLVFMLALIMGGVMMIYWGINMVRGRTRDEDIAQEQDEDQEDGDEGQEG